MPVNGVAVASIGAGTVFLWSALHNASVLKVLHEIAAGKRPTGKPPAAQPPPGQESQINQSLGINDNAPGISTGSVSQSKNRALMQLMAAAYGWASGAQWDALVDVTERESGFNNEVYNGGTVGGPYQPNKAYGIAQALGHGPDGAPYPAGNLGNPPGAGGISSATAQIAWMLSYIKSAYGNPEGALNSENTRGWY